jgi:hypothetical protein
MNRPLLITTALLGAVLPAQAEPATGAGDIRPVIRAMREEISARPSRVLIAVEDALTMNELAACEIVKEAITSTKADSRLVGEIVFTALCHAPAMSAPIVECAVSTSPDCVHEIELAVERALGGKAGTVANVSEGSGKAPAGEGEVAETGKASAPTGKGAVVPTLPGEEDGDTYDSFLRSSVGVGGIYLLIPSQSFHGCLPGDPCCSGELSASCLKP